MLITLARADALDTVTALLAAQFDEHAISSAPEVVRSAVRGVLEQPARGAFLVASDATPVGLAYLAFIWTLEYGGKTAWLEELYVIPEQRSRGVGAALLRAAMNAARETGCAAMDLEVDDDRARAARLYERAGFRRLGRSRWCARLVG